MKALTSLNDKVWGKASTQDIRPLRRDDLDFHELDGEAVLYDAQSGAVHRFNAVTVWIWDACDGHRTTAEIARMLSEEYSVATDHALAHAQRAIEGFEARGLLQGEPVEKAITGIGGDEPSPPRKATEGPRGLSRREVLRSTTGKMALAAPLISTFFAAGAYASAPASGPGGCKLLGFSCTVAEDCCVLPPDGKCENFKCCIKKDRAGCEFDSDCCDYPIEICIDGVCQ